MRTAAVVLAGGSSSRMGSPKAWLDWHGSTLLRHVAGVAARGQQGRVVVVRAPGQQLPALPDRVEVREDPREGRGPLQGIAVGLAALVDDADVAFVCSTDLPFLHTAFVRRVLRAFQDQAPEVDVVLPLADGHPQPLAAGYRTALAPRVAQLVEADILKPALLFEECSVLRLDPTALLADRELAAADPELDSVTNVNDGAGYAAARARPAPEVSVQCFGVVAPGGHGVGRRHQVVRAATVGAAAAAVGITWDRHVLAAVNGDQTGRDGHEPLVRGDSVAFLSAAPGG